MCFQNNQSSRISSFDFETAFNEIHREKEESSLKENNVKIHIQTENAKYKEYFDILRLKNSSDLYSKLFKTTFKDDLYSASKRTKFIKSK